jgi:hypothetical protein
LRHVVTVCGWLGSNREAKGTVRFFVLVIIVLDFVVLQEGEAHQEGPVRGGSPRSQPFAERSTRPQPRIV